MSNQSALEQLYKKKEYYEGALQRAIDAKENGFVIRSYQGTLRDIEKCIAKYEN